ncbi:MAG: response regulator transcription factor [Chloroflexota bacterium]
MKILVVDDDPDIMQTVSMCFAIRWPEADVIEAASGESAMDRAASERLDMVILDLGLPDIDGLDVFRRIRALSDVPVIMLTARGSDTDRVRGLEMGADDYIPKPFNHMELLARVRAVMRRTQSAQTAFADDAFEQSGLRFDFASREVVFRGTRLQLTPLEYNLLSHLVRNYPRVVPHKVLLRGVWGPGYENETDYLKVHVQRIRSKFGAVEPGFDPIANERGIGYRLSLSDDE